MDDVDCAGARKEVIVQQVLKCYGEVILLFLQCHRTLYIYILVTHHTVVAEGQLTFQAMRRSCVISIL